MKQFKEAKKILKMETKYRELNTKAFAIGVKTDCKNVKQINRLLNKAKKLDMKIYKATCAFYEKYNKQWYEIFRFELY